VCARASLAAVRHTSSLVSSCVGRRAGYFGWKTDSITYVSPIVTDRFSGPGRAIGRVCVSTCPDNINFKLHHLTCTAGVWTALAASPPQITEYIKLCLLMHSATVQCCSSYVSDLVQTTATSPRRQGLRSSADTLSCSVPAFHQVGRAHVVDRWSDCMEFSAICHSSHVTYYCIQASS